MRLLHINLAKGWRGGERQTLFLMQGLREQGQESVLLARRGDELARRAKVEGLEVIEIAKPYLLSGHHLGRFDCVHVHEVRALQLAAIWKLFNHKPLVVTRRVDYTPGTNRFTRFKYRQADRLVAISEKIRSVMGAWGLDVKQIPVINSAIDMQDRADPKRVAELQARFAGKKVVGCVAALVGHKDHATLIRAMVEIGRQRDDVALVVLGDGKLESELRLQVERLGLKNVHFEGYQDDPYSYYKIFDCFALTSKEEGLGSAILDAFYYHVPVVATAAGGIPELIEDEQTGWLLAVGDDAGVAQSILQVLADDSACTRRTTEAASRVRERFSVTAMVQHYQQVYAEL